MISERNIISSSFLTKQLSLCVLSILRLHAQSLTLYPILFLFCFLFLILSLYLQLAFSSFIRVYAQNFLTIHCDSTFGHAFLQQICDFSPVRHSNKWSAEHNQAEIPAKQITTVIWIHSVERP